MFSYLHRYHAGCYADVHKHLILIALIERLQQKNTSFCILDPFAGEGLYDLQSAQSQQTKEFIKGFFPLLKIDHPPPLIKTYLDVLSAYNQRSQFRYYPGSPAIIKQLLRPHDKAILIEGHPRCIKELRRHFGKNSQLHIHQRDAHEFKSLVPFKEKRGIIFIDPSYEVKTEYKQIVKTLKSAYIRFPQGIYAIWYPLLRSQHHKDLLNAIAENSFAKVWHHEWFPYPKNETKGLYASGMIILNAPWQFDADIKKLFYWLNSHVYLQGPCDILT